MAHPTRYILHLDMDAFYPSVEVLDDPSLRGRPVIVGGISKRGVVSSASYEARRFGVHSAQPMAEAIRRCPKGVFLPVRMARYQQISRQVFAIFHRFTPLVEALSIDEAFLDVTGCDRLFGSPEEIARLIKEAVRKEIGLTVSAGIGPSKFISKIASDIQKPDGLVVVSAEKVREFLDPLPISKMWGVGKVTQTALESLGVKTFEDLRKMSAGIVERRFGRHGLHMHQLASGLDDRQVVPEHEAKTIGHEETFLHDIMDAEEARRELLSLTEKVARRLRRNRVCGKTVTLKVKYADFVQVTRSATLVRPTDDGPDLYASITSLLGKTQVGKRPVRLLGVSVSHLDRGSGDQLSLFDDPDPKKRQQLNSALDTLSEKHGVGVVRRARLLGPHACPPG